MDERPVDIVLVRMPYGETGQPSLALGLLKAGCEARNLSNRVLAANIWFAEEIGLAIHDLIFESYSTTLIGEWTFAGALFQDFRPDDESYLQKVIKIFRLDSSREWRYLHQRYPHLDYIKLLREIRRRAPDFIERTAERILQFEPKIVGCSSTFQQHCASLALLRAIKQKRPEVITMIGGANCEGDMGRITFEQFGFLDFVVSGEADEFFAPMCEKLIRSGINAELPSLPAGVWGPQHRITQSAIRDACNGNVDGAPIVRLEDMNRSPAPNYDDYFAALRETMCLGGEIKPALPFQTARGCWWGEKTHCTFCGISRTAMKFRAKSADNVIDHMLFLRDRYGISTFQGTEYIFDYRFFTSLLPKLRELNSIFRFEVKANLKVEQLQALAESGTVEVQPGVESLHDGALALLKKGVTAHQNLMLLKRGREIGLSIYWNFLHTIPGEQDEWYGEMADLVPLLHHLQPPSGFAQIHYDRFSPYWRDPSAHGLTLQPAFGYEQVYPFPQDVLKDIAYFFETPQQRDGFLVYDEKTHAGLYRLSAELRRWRAAFSSRPRPRLVVKESQNTMQFEDTREVASARFFEIAGLEMAIYACAHEGITPANLLNKLRGEGLFDSSEADVREAIEHLLDKKVVASVSGRLLGLAVRTDRPLIVEGLDRPAAELDPLYGKLKADVLLDEKRSSIALWCLRQPKSESLDNWLGRLGGSRKELSSSQTAPS
jgi:ribosomal peptide maturation radical SAM protein 1